MIAIRKTAEFERWIEQLRDREARLRIHVRIRRLMAGNPGDQKPVGEGVWELRIPYGPGYRVYYTRQGNECVLLLVGGDKRTQANDIRQARNLAWKK